MRRILDHIDLRAPRLEDVRPFYEAFLPALGFTRDARIEGWLQFEAADAEVSEFFGITESPDHRPNENRIAFWAESTVEVDRLAALAIGAGAEKVEGPDYETPSYYAVFFEDPCGNRLEICHRTASCRES
jgi:catechol 2,3-dioxygenase-like lactoylglutathione lyase family enzyme